MATYDLIISPAAREDLENIFKYGRENFGMERSSRYLDNLKDRIWQLAETPEIAMRREGLLPDARSLLVEKHIIFCRLNRNRVEVIRILHGRQDVGRHL